MDYINIKKSEKKTIVVSKETWKLLSIIKIQENYETFEMLLSDMIRDKGY